LVEEDNGSVPDRKQFQHQNKGYTPKKILLCVWWDIRWVIFFELVENKKIDSKVYCEQLIRLEQALAVTRPQLVGKGVVFHQDNARAHTSMMTKKKIQDLGWSILGHPPYSPDLAPQQTTISSGPCNIF